MMRTSFGRNGRGSYGRGQGTFGRGRGKGQRFSSNRSNNQNRNKYQQIKTKTLRDYTFDIGGAERANQYISNVN
jgi:hypothetical protein